MSSCRCCCCCSFLKKTDKVWWHVRTDLYQWKSKEEEKEDRHYCASVLKAIHFYLFIEIGKKLGDTRLTFYIRHYHRRRHKNISESLASRDKVFSSDHLQSNIKCSGTRHWKKKKKQFWQWEKKGGRMCGSIDFRQRFDKWAMIYVRQSPHETLFGSLTWLNTYGWTCLFRHQTWTEACFDRARRKRQACPGKSMWENQSSIIIIIVVHSHWRQKSIDFLDDLLCTHADVFCRTHDESKSRHRSWCWRILSDIPHRLICLFVCFLSI